MYGLESGKVFAVRVMDFLVMLIVEVSEDQKKQKSREIFFTFLPRWIAFLVTQKYLRRGLGVG